MVKRFWATSVFINQLKNGILSECIEPLPIVGGVCCVFVVVLYWYRCGSVHVILFLRKIIKIIAYGIQIGIQKQAKIKQWNE